MSPSKTSAGSMSSVPDLTNPHCCWPEPATKSRPRESAIKPGVEFFCSCTPTISGVTTTPSRRGALCSFAIRRKSATARSRCSKMFAATGGIYCSPSAAAAPKAVNCDAPVGTFASADSGLRRSAFCPNIHAGPRSAGPGSFARLGEAQVSLTNTDTVLLTHLHIDHAGELPGLFKARAVSATGPIAFDVWGPEGSPGQHQDAYFPSTSQLIRLLFGPKGAYAYLSDFSSPMTIHAHDIPAPL